MDKLIVEGGNPLRGEVSVHGAKNSSLPILAATILCQGETVLHNCPKLSDVDAACKILSCLGCSIKRSEDVVLVEASNVNNFDIPDNLMREMRSSIVFLGPIIARTGRAKLTFPGGCELGPRPIDLHLWGLRKLGVEIKEEQGSLDCYVKGRLKGAKISLSFPSVGATENIMLASVTALGKTTITNAAQEPEIVDLANYLNKCGAKIRGAGKNTIHIEGVDKLYPCEHNVISDRIVAATYLCGVAITKGEALIKNINPNDLNCILPILEQMGCKLVTSQDSVYINTNKRILAADKIRTMPHPGFPTDAQAPLMALTTLAKGTTIFLENIFENRYGHANELMRMGANIKVEGKVAVVEGVDKLYGAKVSATDLRGGAALVIAGLSAQGTTIIDNIKHIDRGYESIETSFNILEGRILRG